MIRAFQWDLARQVERLDWLLEQMPRYADWGYTELYLHLEDAVEFPSLPGVARSDAYTHREIGRLVDAATSRGIGVVPIVNLLGHTQYLIKVPELRDLNELRAADGSPLERGQICPLHPRTMEIAARLIGDMTPFCTAGKVHVGLDESFHLGKHPLSRREISSIGYGAHFGRYVTRLRDLCRSQRLRMGMWADMLYFLPDAIPHLPRDVALYEWYYYSFRRRPRVELFNFLESDLGERLHREGFEYWGCPMNGAFRHEPLPHFADRLENIRSWWRRCQALDATGFLVTSWEPNRLAQELTTVVDAAAACLWLDPGVRGDADMLERGFARVYGANASRAAAKLALACDKYPFGGYPRWQVNSSWETASPRESIVPYRSEARYFRRLSAAAARDTAIPAPLSASIAFRRYLADRDVFIRAGGPRPDVAAAVKAATTMWESTRAHGTCGPNHQILADDAARIRQHQHATTRGWRVCYRVENVAPAIQLVAVEQQEPDGTWRTVQACHTIEFQSRAARRRGGLAREHAAPIAWDGTSARPPVIRFALRGIGQVRLAHVELRSGRRHVRVKLPRRVLGLPAPSAGFPAIDWSANQDTIAVPLH